MGHGLLFHGISLERRAVFSRLLAGCILCGLFRGFRAGALHVHGQNANLLLEYRSGVFRVFHGDWDGPGFVCFVLISGFGRARNLFLAGDHVQDAHSDLLAKRGLAYLCGEYVYERGARFFSWMGFLGSQPIIKPFLLTSQTPGTFYDARGNSAIAQTRNKINAGA